MEQPRGHGTRDPACQEGAQAEGGAGAAGTRGPGSPGGITNLLEDRRSPPPDSLHSSFSLRPWEGPNALAPQAKVI